MSSLHFPIAALLAGLVSLLSPCVLARGPGAPPPNSASPAMGGTDWVGKVAPDFALHDLQGHLVRLEEFRGKVVLVNFWATWCAPCRVEMPWLVELYARYRTQGLEILGVSVDDDQPDRVRRFVQDRQVKYRIVLEDDAVVDAYGGLRFLPQTFFIGRDGRILERTYGIRTKEELEADIRRALSTAHRGR